MYVLHGSTSQKYYTVHFTFRLIIWWDTTIKLQKELVSAVIHLIISKRNFFLLPLLKESWIFHQVRWNLIFVSVYVCALKQHAQKIYSCWLHSTKRTEDVLICCLLCPQISSNHERSIVHTKHTEGLLSHAVQVGITVVFCVYCCQIKANATTIRRLFLLWLRLGVWCRLLHDYSWHKGSIIRVKPPFQHIIACKQLVNTWNMPIKTVLR